MSPAWQDSNMRVKSQWSGRRPPQLRAGGRPGESGCSILWHRTVCFVLFFLRCMIFCFLFAMRLQLGTSPLEGLWVVPPFHSVLVYTFSSRHPTTVVACGRVLKSVSLVIACAFSFNSPFSVSPPRYAGGIRGRFLTVVCLII